MNWSNMEIIWRDKVPSDEIIAQVRKDIETELADLDNPVDLVFHTVFLTDDYEGPTVVISGFEDRDDAWDAGYYP